MTASGLTGRTLESSLSRLEVIVASLERDDLELEEALALFEEGIACVRVAREILRAAELRVEHLIDEVVRDDAADPSPAEPH
ncbi:MAG TPA: exodeoxyribonuclease VII small subunit [Longimicrobiales bacterium]|nr:exodeoxyribonuclease VII small subunit [Longimicrobiales bacterium]